MHANEWMTPATIVSVIGIILTLVSLRFVIRVDRRQRGQDQPTVSFVIEPSRESADWWNVSIRIRNRTDLSWRAEEVRLSGGVRGASETQGYETTASGRNELSLLKLRDVASSKPIPLGLDISPSGRPRTQHSWGDEAHGNVLLLASTVRKRVSMKLILRPMDSRARAITIRLNRSVPARSESPTD